MGVPPSNKNGWTVRKDGASFRIHSRLRIVVIFRTFFMHRPGQADTSWRHVRSRRQTRLLVCLRQRLCTSRNNGICFVPTECSFFSANRHSDSRFKQSFTCPPSGCHTLTPDRLTARNQLRLQISCLSECAGHVNSSAHFLSCLVFCKTP